MRCRGAFSSGNTAEEFLTGFVSLQAEDEKQKKFHLPPSVLDIEVHRIILESP